MLPSNPYYAVLNCKINGIDVINRAGRPASLLSFEYYMVGDVGANQVKLALFDPEWNTIENIITAFSPPQMEFSFGYMDGDMSDIYICTIMNYSPTFTIDGVNLMIEGISTALGGDDKDAVRSRSFPEAAGKDEMDIHEIVEWICQQNGWIPHVDPTESVYDNADKDESKRKKQTFIQTSQRDLQFISEVLLPRAKRLSDGNADYRLFFEDKSTPVLHFHPPRYNDPLYQTYQFMRDKLSPVVSFSPEITGRLNFREGGGVASVPYIDPQTGEYQTISVNNQTTPTKTVIGGPMTSGRPIQDNNHTVVEIRPIRDLDSAFRAAEHRYYRAFDQLYRSDATLVGDPKFKPHYMIRMNVVDNQFRTHYVSGIYHVMNVNHSINGGEFLTTLEMFRNGRPGGGSGEAVVGTVRQ